MRWSDSPAFKIIGISFKNVNVCQKNMGCTWRGTFFIIETCSIGSINLLYISQFCECVKFFVPTSGQLLYLVYTPYLNDLHLTFALSHKSLHLILRVWTSLCSKIKVSLFSTANSIVNVINLAARAKLLLKWILLHS